ncbi:hypothetical protein DNTS_008575, partial [Danionella cerebrum]
MGEGLATLQFSFTICYSVTAQKGLFDSEFRELLAVFSACVKLYFYFLCNFFENLFAVWGKGIII